MDLKKRNKNRLLDTVKLFLTAIGLLSLVGGLFFCILWFHTSNELKPISIATFRDKHDFKYALYQTNSGHLWAGRYPDDGAKLAFAGDAYIGRPQIKKIYWISETSIVIELEGNAFWEVDLLKGLFEMEGPSTFNGNADAIGEKKLIEFDYEFKADAPGPKPPAFKDLAPGTQMGYSESRIHTVKEILNIIERGKWMISLNHIGID